MSSPTTLFQANLLAELLPKREFGYALPYLMALRSIRMACVYSSDGRDFLMTAEGGERRHRL